MLAIDERTAAWHNVALARRRAGGCPYAAWGCLTIFEIASQGSSEAEEVENDGAQTHAHSASWHKRTHDSTARPIMLSNFCGVSNPLARSAQNYSAHLEMVAMDEILRGVPGGTWHKRGENHMKFD